MLIIIHSRELALLNSIANQPYLNCGLGYPALRPSRVKQDNQFLASFIIEGRFKTKEQKKRRDDRRMLENYFIYKKKSVSYAFFDLANFQGSFQHVEKRRTFAMGGLLLEQRISQNLRSRGPLLGIKREYLLKKILLLGSCPIFWELSPELVVHLLAKQQEVAVCQLGLFERDTLPAAGQEQFKADDPCREHIRFARVSPTFVDFGGDVPKGSHQFIPLLGLMDGHTEIDELQIITVVDEKILGLDISVDNLMGVHNQETLGHVADDAVADFSRHGARTDKMPEVAVLEILHDQKGLDDLAQFAGGTQRRGLVNFKGLDYELVFYPAENLRLVLEGPPALMPMFVNFEPVELFLVFTQQNPKIAAGVLGLSALLDLAEHVVGPHVG